MQDKNEEQGISDHSGTINAKANTTNKNDVRKEEDRRTNGVKMYVETDTQHTRMMARRKSKQKDLSLDKNKNMGMLRTLP